MNNNRHPIYAIVLMVLLLPALGVQAAVRYVALSGSDTNGQSWATAYITIQHAIDDPTVKAGDEIWVKQGTYETMTSILVNKAVKIYGGYSGSGSTRNWQTYVTIIDGMDEAKHGFNVTTDARIDGFTITNCHAWGQRPGDEGGGMYLNLCSPTVANCTFYRNHAAYVGGGISTDRADGATITNCTFLENTASYFGAGIHNHDSDMTIIDCDFSANATRQTLDGYGGGIFNEECAPTIRNCTFTENMAFKGAGICNYYADPLIEACTFADCNAATANGGGIWSYGNSATVRDCLFVGNSVTGGGAAIYDQSSSTYINCVIQDNVTSFRGGGVYINTGEDDVPSEARFINCTLVGNRGSWGGALYSNNASAKMINCIAWGNQALDGAGIYNDIWVWPVSTEVRYSNIEGDSTYPGIGNIRIDPGFTDLPNGDFRLPFGSPCVDAGDNAVVGLPADDLDGNTRVVDGDENGVAVVDMGAYEFQGRPDADHLISGQIVQGLLYANAADADPDYVFLMELETDDTVDAIAFLTPAGQSCLIPKDPATVAGDVETSHHVYGSTHVWRYWGAFDNAGALADYGDGTYTITLTYTNTTTHQTHVPYVVPGTSNPIGQPTQKPSITSPAYDALAPSPVTLTWNACSDTDADSIFLAIIDPDTDEDVATDGFDVGATTSNAYTLSEGLYDAELGFARFYDIIDADGTPFECGKVVIVEHRFEVPYTSVYRFWAPAAGRHFYTISEAEKNKLIDNYSDVWTYEGPAYSACATPYDTDLVPVYRFWSAKSKAHFYTISESEKDKLVNNFSDVWTFEGTAFYAYPEGSQPAECKPVYRFWKSADNTHFYTITEAEKDKLIAEFSHVYVFEGISFYAHE